MVKIVSLFAWSLIVIDGTKDFCCILGMMHMTRKIASEDQDLPGSHTIMENVQHFLESQGLLQQAMSIGDVVDDITGLKLASSTQTTLHDYFH